MLAGGRPDRLFIADGIHMNAAGYSLWAGAVRHALAAELPPAAVNECASGAAQ
jgi:lysophospholipase L1-like esterase